MKTALCFVLLFLLSSECTSADLKRTPFSLQEENELVEKLGLSRIPDDLVLQRFKQLGILVPLRETKGLVIDRRLDEKFRFVLPWTRNFLEELGEKFYGEFRHPLQINSAVRTIIYQKQLQKKNKNAAATTGDRQSTHPTGATVDIAKLPLKQEHILWLQNELQQLKQNGQIHVTEEWFQACFHVMVVPLVKEEPREILPEIEILPFTLPEVSDE